MNDRERRWYEGKYGWHPPTCTCVACFEKRKAKEEDMVQAQARMREGIEEMNDTERDWYEGKYGRHPPTCACVACDLARRTKQEVYIEAEMKKMRKEERQMFMKSVVRIAVPVVVITIVVLGLLGVEPWVSAVDVIGNLFAQITK